MAMDMDLVRVGKKQNETSKHIARVVSSEQESSTSTGQRDIKFVAFLYVVLERPQVNFLCEKTHSSLVIHAARANVQGRMHEHPMRYSNEPLPHTKVEITLRMDRIAAYTVPSDLEGIDRVYWRESAQDSANSSPARDTRAHLAHQLLREVVEKSNFAASYTFYSSFRTREDDSYVLESDEELTCQFFLDLPELSIWLASDEFFIVLNVVRNVLLAPPPIPTEVRLQRKHDSMLTLAFASSRRPAEVQEKLDLYARGTRNDIKRTIELNMSTIVRDQSSVFLAREVQYLIGRGKWVLRGASGADDDLEVAFLGLHGHHLFKSDSSTSLYFDVQRLWCTNLKPGAMRSDAVLSFITKSLGLLGIRQALMQSMFSMTRVRC
jgi:hypothetical protein